jgi:heat shock protein HslJ
MTDELMDARLHAAGESWRSANTLAVDVPNEPTEDLNIGPRRPHRGRWITYASAAVVAAALVVGGIVVASGSRDDGRTPKAAASADTALTGHSWVLTDGQATLTFARGSVSLDDGCDAFTRRISVDGNRLTFGAHIGKARVCSPTVSEADRLNHIENILTGTVTWSVSGDRLTVTRSDSATAIGTLTFVEALVGRTWQLVSFTDHHGRQPVVDPDATFTISADQRLVGNDGCNTMGGDVQVHSDTIDFGQLAVTDMACNAVTATKTATYVDSMLTGSVAYHFRGGKLTLTKSGVGTLVYQADASMSLAALINKDWTLTGTQVTKTSGNASSGSGDAAVSLSVVTFDDGHFTVRHRCYTNAGRAALSNSTADLSDVKLKTAIPCPSGAESKAGQRENDFVDALLTGAVSWSIDKTVLTVSKDNGHQATFDAGAPSSPTNKAAIQSSDWVVQSLTDGSGADIPVPAGSGALTLRVMTDGVAVVGNKCYLVSMLITLGNGTIIANSHDTAPTCAAVDLDAGERQTLVQALNGYLTWSIHDDVLTITNGTAGTITFTREP